MKASLFFCTMAAALLAAACGDGRQVSVSVTNPLDLLRAGELVEVSLHEVTTKLGVPDTASLRVLDADGREVPCQRTYDGKLLFPAAVGAKGQTVYRVQPGTPAAVPVRVCGRQYPERLDDLAWENDLVAFRAYGPALQATGERGYGYDLLAKRATPDPVLEARYALDLNPETHVRISALRKTDPAAADSLSRSTSYHVDHGNGMDCYAVGPTLGGGTTALLNAEGEIVYPWCYRTCEVLDNGPLRFTARLTFNPLQVDGDTAVVETRIITLDLGSHLNKTVVSYTGLSHDAPLVTGIVLHDDSEPVADASAGYIAYADPTTGSSNGTLFVGAVFPADVSEARKAIFPAAEQKQRSGAKGHVLASSDYQPGADYVYYWGFGWDRADVKDFEAWKAYLRTFAQKARNPLTVETGE